MALGSTQPLVEMSTRNIPGGKGGRCVRLTSPPSRAECHKLGSLNLLEPSGPHRACYGIPLPLPYHSNEMLYTQSVHGLLRPNEMDFVT